MIPSGTQAQLFINGKNVGAVQVSSTCCSWGFGEFSANENFAEFASLFGQWSLLMHADDDQSHISPAAAEELFHTERAIDSLRAELVVPHHPHTLHLAQINIDGPLIEWKLLERLPHL